MPIQSHRNPSIDSQFKSTDWFPHDINCCHDIKVETAYTRKWLSSCFKTKDKTKFEHQHDIIYQVKCTAENCPDSYTRESARHVIERVKDHGGKNTEAHVLKHSIEKEHAEVTQKDFKIIGSHFKNNGQKKNKNKRKIAEALLIKQEFPSLNVQDQSVELTLVNYWLWLNIIILSLNGDSLSCGN